MYGWAGIWRAGAESQILLMLTVYTVVTRSGKNEYNIGDASNTVKRDFLMSLIQIASKNPQIQDAITRDTATGIHFDICK